MTPIGYLVLLGWIPFVLLIASRYGGQKGLVTSFLLGYLLLPQGVIPLSGIPDLTRDTVTSYSLILAILMVDRGQMARFRPHFCDLVIVTWCVLQGVAAATNGDDTNEIVSAVFEEVLTWGIPYLLGRIYLGDREGMRLLGMSFIWGVILYSPLILFEHRMSPVLHSLIFGIRESKKFEARGTGYRPWVFLRNGLEMGMLLCIAMVSAFHTWRMKAAPKRLLGVHFGIWVGFLFFLLVAEKVLGSLMLAFIGIGTLMACKLTRSKWPSLILLLLPPLYISTRATHVYDPQPLVDLVATYSEERAQSLDTRIHWEDVLMERAEERQLFGWGRLGGRWRIRNEEDQDVTFSDGCWIIVYGISGAAGLTTWTIMIGLPLFLAWRSIPKRQWMAPENAFTVAVLTCLSLYFFDSLANRHIVPFYYLGLGGLTSFSRWIRREGVHDEEEDWTDLTEEELDLISEQGHRRI